MKKLLVLILLIATASYGTAQNLSGIYPVYNGKDLGLTYSPKAATFKIWAPTATAAKLNLYKTDMGGTAIRTINLNKGENSIGKLPYPKILKIATILFKLILIIPGVKKW